MTMTALTIRQFLTEHEAGAFHDPAVETQVRAGWFDWFLDDADLHKVTAWLGSILAHLSATGLDLDTHTVTFTHRDERDAVTVHIRHRETKADVATVTAWFDGFTLADLFAQLRAFGIGTPQLATC